MTGIDLILGALAVWRVCALLSYERGPWDVFVKLRSRIGIMHDEDGTPSGYDEARFFAGLVFCCWCLSVWVAGVLWLAFLVWPDGARAACVPLALSAGAIAIERWNHGTS